MNRVCGLILIVFLFSIFSYSFTVFGQTSNPDQATFIITSNTKWQGSFGSTGSANSADGTGNKNITFDCRTGDSYVANVQKQTDSGYLSINIWQDGKPINSAVTQSSFGVVTISGTCHVQRTASTNAGIVSFATTKDVYSYGEGIHVTVSLLDGISADPTVKVLNSDGTEIYSAIPSTSSQNNLDYLIEAVGTKWKTAGNYYIVVSVYNAIAVKEIQIKQSVFTNLSDSVTDYTINTDKSIYKIGESVTIYGTLFTFNSNTYGTVTVLDPGAKIVDKFDISSANGKRFLISLDPLKYQAPGDYLALFNVGQNGGDSGRVRFTISENSNIQNNSPNTNPDGVKIPTVPEFGSLSGMIIAISVIGVLTISRKFRFHF